jgi:hypothetical protein
MIIARPPAHDSEECVVGRPTKHDVEPEPVAVEGERGVERVFHLDPVCAKVMIVSAPTLPLHLPVKSCEYPATALALTARVLVPAVRSPSTVTTPVQFCAVVGASALGDDGDPLDVLILRDAPAHVGCLVDVRLAGVICAEQIEDGKKETNDRLLAVAIDSCGQKKALKFLKAGLEAHRKQSEE